MVTPQTRNEWIEFLKRYEFTHFVTLALNDPMATVNSAERVLSGWEARANRLLIGPKWARYLDRRIFAFYFLEKPNSNPHWHGLVMLDPHPVIRAEQAFVMEMMGETLLKRVQRAGTFRISAIHDLDGIVRYTTKEIENDVSYLAYRLPKGRRSTKSRRDLSVLTKARLPESTGTV